MCSYFVRFTWLKPKEKYFFLTSFFTLSFNSSLLYNYPLIYSSCNVFQLRIRSFNLWTMLYTQISCILKKQQRNNPHKVLSIHHVHTYVPDPWHYITQWPWCSGLVTESGLNNVILFSVYPTIFCNITKIRLRNTIHNWNNDCWLR